MRKIISHWLVPGIAFLLPWQTRWIFGGFEVQGQVSEFGIYSLFAVEVLVLAAFLLLWPLKIRQEYRLPVWLLSLVGVMAAMSIGLASDGLLALNQWLHLLFAGIFFIILLDERVDLRRVLVGLGLGLIVPSFIGIWQFFVGRSEASTWLGLAARDATRLGDSVLQINSQRILRAYGSFSHPNIFGGYLAVALAALLGLWSSLKTKSTVVLAGLVGFILSFALVLTFSRSAWLGLGLGLLVGALVMAIKDATRAKKIVLPLSIVIITVAVIGSVARFGLSSEFESRSINERVEQYQEFPAVIGSNWILGQGLGNYTVAAAEVFTSRVWYELQPVHNVPLLILGEIGLLGLLAIIIWAASIDRINFARFPKRAAVTAFMMGNTILVIAFFDHYLWSTWSGLALVALVMAATVRFGED